MCESAKFLQRTQKYGKSNPSLFDSQLRQGVIDFNGGVESDDERKKKL